MAEKLRALNRVLRGAQTITPHGVVKFDAEGFALGPTEEQVAYLLEFPERYAMIDPETVGILDEPVGDGEDIGPEGEEPKPVEETPAPEAPTAEKPKKSRGKRGKK